MPRRRARERVMVHNRQNAGARAFAWPARTQEGPHSRDDPARGLPVVRRAGLRRDHDQSRSPRPPTSRRAPSSGTSRARNRCCWPMISARSCSRHSRRSRWRCPTSPPSDRRARRLQTDDGRGGGTRTPPAAHDLAARNLAAGLRDKGQTHAGRRTQGDDGATAPRGPHELEIRSSRAR